MVVLITNITDATPGKKPTQVDIYNKTLDPGGNIKLPADLVNSKIRALERSGLIAIGNLPPWYVTAKTKKGRPLTDEERAKMQVAPPKLAPVPTPLKKKDEEKVKGKPLLMAAVDEVQDQLKSTKG